jgi:predicted nucleic acid-binding protein
VKINYSIKANIVDIKLDKPQRGERFLVDSCVWYWMTYPAASLYASEYQMDEYPRYVNEALKANSEIYRAELSFAELAHLIETTQHRMYRNLVREIDFKNFRHNLPDERTSTISKIEASWDQIKSMAKPLEGIVDENLTEVMLKDIKLKQMDGYDMFILETMKSNGIDQIISDDGDFSTVEGINVFTANRNVIKAARQVGKMLNR